MTDAPSPAAGWYPDPQASDRNRYWDGRAWTEATAPRPDARPTAGPGVDGSGAPAIGATGATPPVASPWSQTPPGNHQGPPGVQPPVWGSAANGGGASFTGYPGGAHPHAAGWQQQGIPQVQGGWQGSAQGQHRPSHGATPAHLPEYYSQAFATIDGGQTKIVWNWAAFLLGALWYLYRGMWAKALIYVAVAIFSGGFLILPLWIYGGLMGTYDLWLLHRRGTQTW
jgi:hypothetical protein